MKAKFFFLGLCALALAACSIDEVSQVNDTNAIQFKTTVATRAAATTTNTINDFSVWAWNNGNEFMDGVVASRQSAGSNVFTTSPLYFWPTGSVDFYAITPSAELFGVEGDGVERAYFGGEFDDSDAAGWTYSGYVGKATVANGAISVDVTVPHDAGDQIDLCYAVAKEQTSGGVTMNFRHIFSQLAFKALNTNEEMTIKIDGVSVCSVFQQGTYSLPTVSTFGNLASADLGTDDIADTQGAWSETLTHKAKFNAGIANTTLSGVSAEAENITSDPLMVLPQEVEAWDVYTDPTDNELGSYIRIACNISENGSQLWPNGLEESQSDNLYTGSDGLEYAEIAIPVDANWAEGYRYTYTLIFGEGAGYYPPDDPNTDYDGTPILYPITFNVTVDEFQDAVAEDDEYDVTTKTGVVKTAKDLQAAVAAQYSPIEIAADITLDGYLEINYDCELTIDAGCTLTGPDGTEDCHIEAEVFDGYDDLYYTAIIYVNGGNLTIYGEGTVATGGSNDSDYTSAILVADGTVTIYGGTYKGSNWSGDVSDLYTRSAVYCSNGGYAYIYDGNFYAGPSSRNNKDLDYGYHWVLNVKNSAYTAENAMIYCYGGTYYDGFDPADLRTDDAPSYCADGYGTAYDEDSNTYTVILTTVATPADLYAAVEAGASEITLDADVALESHDLFFYDDCELNLNGHTLTGVDVADDEDCSGANSVIFVYDGTLTVNGPGTITTEGSGTDGEGGTGSGDTSIFWLTGGELIINGGTYNGGSWKDTTGSDYTASSATVYVQSGFAYIYDGTFTCGVANAFKSDGWKTKEGYTESIINIYDAARNTDPKTGWAYVYGGTYRNFDPGNNPCEGANTNFCAEGYASDEGVEDADGNTWFTVSAK